MKAAFIVMSILGCDDSGVHCTPVASVSQEWQSIAACDAASESVLKRYQNVKKPMVAAICQTADTGDDIEPSSDISESTVSQPPAPPPAHKDDHEGLMTRAKALFGRAVPSRAALQKSVEAPVHFVGDTYSWVARKISP
ncbi:MULTISPECIES: hypothetical protein [unclassified Rhizobium]|uniref:hypothetical protein n=1 Tax=unclassified Rhizobium TaxID=2613769 RepID=UPI0015FFC8C8|nr:MULTISPECIES: hypothetical protein [unclassified Rhizobium]MBB1247599.1 hypothetical protein [Rhizobium sp. G21]MCV3764134.1 hypothetical protein [Rhizobium sp. TRM95796]